ncbi:MAG TPA: DinB family protein [Gemmatimonadales bacterium]|nr:DinB family protein [Gemmatimonadales bacterium]
MHPRLVELLEYVGAQRAVLLASVEAVPAERRDVRPAPEVWSVAEVLEHLCLTETGIGRLVARCAAEARQRGLEPEDDVSSLLGALDRFGLVRGARVGKAPEIVAPSGTWSWSEGLQRLGASREAFGRAVAAGDGLALGRVTFPHPLLGPLSLYQWILFVGQHEARHAAQVRARAAGG